MYLFDINLISLDASCSIAVPNPSDEEQQRKRFKNQPIWGGGGGAF